MRSHREGPADDNQHQQDAVRTRSGRPARLDHVRAKDHTIYCIVGISNPSTDVKYKFVWSYYDRSSNQRKDLFTQDLDNQTANEVISKFSSPRDLATGSYTVEVFIDGRMRQQRKFYV